MPVSLHPRGALWVNDYDVGRSGWIVEDPSGHRSAPSVPERETQLPQRSGSVPVGLLSEAAPRVIQVGGVVKAATLALLKSQLDELRALCYAGAVEVRLASASDRFFLARAAEFQHSPIPPEGFNPYCRVRASFYCPDPNAYAVNPTVVGFDSLGTTELPLGSHISAPILRLWRRAGTSPSNPVLTYRDFRGTTIETMTLTVGLDGTPELVEIDCERATISSFTEAGVETTGQVSLWTSGTFLRGFDPQHADPLNGAWPTIQLDNANVVGQALYRKTYLGA